MARVIKYRSESFSSNSKANEFFEKKDFKALDKHLKQLDKDNVALIKHYEDKFKDERCSGLV